MKNRILIIVIAFTSIIQNSIAQKYKLQKTISIKANDVAVDNFGYIYIVTNHEILKYDNDGNLKASFNNIENGDITSIDLTNPLKPLVFFKDFQILNILDNKLSIIQEINFFSSELNQIKLLSNANGENFWIFDESDFKLKKIDKNQKVILESESFIFLFKDFKNIVKLIEYDNQVFILNSEGVKIFDTYGSLQKSIPLDSIKYFQNSKENILFLKNQKLYSYNTKTLVIEQMDIPFLENVQKVNLYKDGLLLLNKTKLQCYKR